MSLLDGNVTLYGRDLEFQVIQESMNKVARGNPGHSSQVVFISGMSGVGKSALAQNILGSATAKGFDVYQTACEPFHEGMSFFPVREIVRQIAGTQAAGGYLAQLYGDGSTQSDMASVSESLSADPSSRREAIVATFTNVIMGRFQNPDARPILIFIDDMEHLDTGSADALICLVSRFGEGRVLLFGAYRSDRVTNSKHPLRTLTRSARRMEGTFTEVQLTGFNQNRFNAFVDVLLPGETSLPKTFYDKLYRETEGNPLFTREVLRMLASKNPDGTGSSLSNEDGVWRYKGDVELWEIPATVEEVIASRLDLLDSEERRKLEFAAVIGRRFAFNIFCGLMDAGENDEDDLLMILDKFRDYELIRELEADDEKFEFSHGKIRDVLYNTLSGLRKRRIHKQVAQVIANTMSSASDDWDSQVGNHLYKAASYAEAFPHLLRAARHFQATGSESDAVRFYRMAVEAAQDNQIVYEASESRQSIRLELAEALITASESGEAGSILEQLTDDNSEDGIQVKALNLLGDVLLYDGDIDQAIHAYEKSETLARKANDDIALCEALCDLAELHGREYESQAGLDPAKADDHRARQLKAADEAYSLLHVVPSTGQLRARILRNKAKLSRVAGNLEEAGELYRQSIDSVDPRVRSHKFQIPYVKTLRRAGNTDEALRRLGQIIDWSSQVGSTRSRGIAEHHQGMVLMTIAQTPEDLTEARNLVLQANRTHKVIRYTQGIRETEMVLGEIALRMNNEGEALNRFRAAVGDNHFSLPELREIVAKELDANGEEDRAEYVAGWESKAGVEG